MPAVRLVNPSRLRRRRAACSNSRRRRKRNMPAGLKRYWARMRRQITSAKRSNPVRRHRRRRARSVNGRRRRRNFSFSGRRRRNPVYAMGRARSYRRRLRHNPLLAVPLGELVPLAGWAVAGMAGTRILPQMLMPGSNTGITGYGINALTAVGLSWVGGKFAGPRAAQGLLVGGIVALAARILSDTLGASSTFGSALVGDLDFDLGFYIPNTYSVPTAGQGPYLLNPGVMGSPMSAGGVIPALPAAGGAAAAAASAPGSAGNPSAAQLSAPGAVHEPKSGSSPWAA